MTREMAHSKSVFTKETENCTRLLQLVTGPCCTALQNILITYSTRRYKKPSFDSVLLDPRVKALLRKFVKQAGNPMNKTQWIVLYGDHYPNENIQSLGKPETFDITLTSLLIRYLCGFTPQSPMGPAVPPPGTKESLGIDPNPSDRSLKANMARIKKCRNFLCHHRSGKISDGDFHAIFDILKQAALDIFDALSHQSSKWSLTSAQLERFRTDPISQDDSEKLEKIRQDWIQYERDVAQKLDIIMVNQEQNQKNIRNLAENQKQVQNEVCDIAECQKEANGVMHNIVENQKRAQSERLEMTENQKKAESERRENAEKIALCLEKCQRLEAAIRLKDIPEQESLIQPLQRLETSMKGLLRRDSARRGDVERISQSLETFERDIEQLGKTDTQPLPENRKKIAGSIKKLEAEMERIHRQILGQEKAISQQKTFVREQNNENRGKSLMLPEKVAKKEAKTPQPPLCKTDIPEKSVTCTVSESVRSAVGYYKRILLASWKSGWEVSGKNPEGKACENARELAKDKDIPARFFEATQNAKKFMMEDFFGRAPHDQQELQDALQKVDQILASKINEESLRFILRKFEDDIDSESSIGMNSYCEKVTSATDLALQRFTSRLIPIEGSDILKKSFERKVEIIVSNQWDKMTKTSKLFEETSQELKKYQEETSPETNNGMYALKIAGMGLAVVAAIATGVGIVGVAGAAVTGGAAAAGGAVALGTAASAGTSGVAIAAGSVAVASGTASVGIGLGVLAKEREEKALKEKEQNLPAKNN